MIVTPVVFKKYGKKALAEYFRSRQQRDGLEQS
jgi:hypothetical protein